MPLPGDGPREALARQQGRLAGIGGATGEPLGEGVKGPGFPYQEQCSRRYDCTAGVPACLAGWMDGS